MGQTGSHTHTSRHTDGRGSGWRGKERIQSCSRRHACGTREEDGKPVYDEYEESPYRPYDNFIIIPLTSAPLFLGLLSTTH